MTPEQDKELIWLLERLVKTLEHEHDWGPWFYPPNDKPSSGKIWRQCSCSTVQIHDPEPNPPGRRVTRATGSGTEPGW